MHQAVRTSTFRSGDILLGRHGVSYTALNQISNRCRNVWRGQTDHQPPRVVVLKSDRSDLFGNEVEALKHVHGHPLFRQLLDTIDGQEVMVLEHLADNLNDVALARPSGALGRGEVKAVGRAVLEGLEFLHGQNRVHTDIKPNNILVDYDKDATSFGSPKICDLGDSVLAQPTTNHAIGAPIFRAPEVFLGLVWSQPVDIWSFGVTILDLLTGKHFFAPPNVPEDDELFDTKVVIRQLGFFGQFPEKMAEIAGPLMPEIEALNGTVADPRLVQRYRGTLAASVDAEDLKFLDYILKVDPRDRPSARELLKHAWFDTV